MYRIYCDTYNRLFNETTTQLIFCTENEKEAENFLNFCKEKESENEHYYMKEENL